MSTQQVIKVPDDRELGERVDGSLSSHPYQGFGDHGPVVSAPGSQDRHDHVLYRAVELVLKLLHGVRCRGQDIAYDVIGIDPVISVAVQGVHDSAGDRVTDHPDRLLGYAGTLLEDLPQPWPASFLSGSLLGPWPLSRLALDRLPAAQRAEALVACATGRVAATRTTPVLPAHVTCRRTSFCSDLPLS